MAAPVLFRLLPPDTGPEAEWYARGAVQRGGLEELAAQHGSQRLVMVVEGPEVLLMSTRVPARKRALMLQALPFQLEDSFAEDVETLHFAAGPRSADGSLAVAVVAREHMDHWLERCAAAGLRLTAMTPMIGVLPLQTGAWTLFLEGDRAALRQGVAAGFSCDRESLDWLLETALQTSGDNPPEAIRVCPAVSAAHPAPRDLPPPWTLEAPVQSPLTLVDYRPGRDINLMQGSYSPRSQLRRLLQPWRAAAVLALCLLGAQLGQGLVERHRLAGQRQALQSEMVALYRQSFPESRNVVNPRLQMERRLGALRSGSEAPGGLLHLLLQSGAPMISIEGVRLRGLNYREGVLDLNITASSLESLDRLRQALTANGDLTVEVQSASSRDGKVQSRLRLQEASS
jgi:general secretion pathway protein L